MCFKKRSKRKSILQTGNQITSRLCLSYQENKKN